MLREQYVDVYQPVVDIMIQKNILVQRPLLKKRKEGVKTLTGGTRPLLTQTPSICQSSNPLRRGKVRRTEKRVKTKGIKKEFILKKHCDEESMAIK